MEQDLSSRLESIEKKLEETHKAVFQLRRYFLWALIISVAVIILPLIGLLFALPGFLSSYEIGGL